MKKYNFKRKFITGSLQGMEVSISVTFSSLQEARDYEGEKKTVESSMVVDTLVGCHENL